MAVDLKQWMEEHFILGCRCLETVRNPVLHELVTKLKECDIDFWQLNETKKIQLILDSTTIGKTRKITSASALCITGLSWLFCLPTFYMLPLSQYESILFCFLARQDNLLLLSVRISYAQMHIRALGLFNNVCRQAEDSSEKALARRQLIVKLDSSSASWFVEIKHLHRKYELKEAISYLDEPLTLNNGWIFPFSRFSNVRNVSPLYNGIKLVILSTHFYILPLSQYESILFCFLARQDNLLLL
jgi:hypothetical protein